MLFVVRGRVYFGHERVLYVGPDVPSVMHAHHAVQVCVSLSGPLRWRTSPRAAWRALDGAIVPSDVPHQTDPPVTLLATFWLDADTPEMSQGATITAAAHAAGFADAAHLDRTFRRMLGFTPSAVRRASRFVQDATART
jgi:AraC-like DNA-binding protein